MANKSITIHDQYIMDSNELELVNAFFSKDSLLSSLCVLCKINKNNPDPISQTIITILNCPIHIQLTLIGLQPFQGRDITFPYNMMTSHQRDCIKDMVVSTPSKWNTYEHAMVFKRSGSPILLKPIDVLIELCSMILSSKIYEDKRLRVAICNIILQRIQANIPLDKTLQTQLNEHVFSVKKPI